MPTFSASDRARRQTPSGPSVAFVDLDDTLFRSRAKALREPGAPTDAAELERFVGRPVTRTRDGRPYSYMSGSQDRLLDVLGRSFDALVPTTARTQDALRRVSLSWSSFAICALGATLLEPDGRPDPELRAEADRRMSEDLGGISWAELARSLDERFPALDVRRVEDDGRDVYLSVRGENSADLAASVPLLASAVPPGIVVSGHDRDVLIRAGRVGKADAVRWVLERHFPDAALTLGVGDREDDAPFMIACDFALTPSRSQLARAWSAP